MAKWIFKKEWGFIGSPIPHSGPIEDVCEREANKGWEIVFITQVGMEGAHTKFMILFRKEDPHG